MLDRRCSFLSFRSYQIIQRLSKHNDELYFILLRSTKMQVFDEDSKISTPLLNSQAIGERVCSSTERQRFQIPSFDTNNNHKVYYSPEYKKPFTMTTNCDNQTARPYDTPRSKKPNIILFTIQQNYYSRKNQNILSQRPPKYRPSTQRANFNNDIQNSECSRQKQKRVIFTQKLITDDQKPIRKESSSAKSIMKNGNDSINDNLSSSSKSISVQNSFVSQLRVSSKIRQRPRTDSNRQKYAQIMSHFQSGRLSLIRNQVRRSPTLINTNQLRLKQQYTDNIFPPVVSSLFLNLPKQNQMRGKIHWQRISESFESEKPVLMHQQHHQTIIRLEENGSLASEYIVFAFNAVKHSHSILERIFEQQKFNYHGLYLIRIFQQNNWKSLIIDDFIPRRNIRVNEKVVNQPAFVKINVPSEKGLQIWPFLLQKAYANYYSAYQMLQYGNAYDFINEITGLAPIEINLKKKSQKQFNCLKQKLKAKDSFAVAQMLSSRLAVLRGLKQQAKQIKLFYSFSPNFTENQLDLAFFQQIKKINYYSPRIYHTLSTATIGKYNSNHNHHHDRSEFSLRKLIVYENTECLISLQQKQARFFCKSLNKYRYMFVRAILVQRQFNGYQWIDGNYNNNKSTILSASLTPGEYYLIIMPEWKQTQNFQLSLLVWANHFVTIQREKGSCEEMIEQACMDLAQRKGKINQLGPTLCSYNYLCPKTGLIIENINNEKLKEETSVHRKVSGIPSTVELLPINKEFWAQKQLINQEIEIKIPKLSSYTIVLRMKGGLDKKLIKMFSNEKEK